MPPDKLSPAMLFPPILPGRSSLKMPSLPGDSLDQLSAIRDIKADMERSQPMDRLICGDVGYGKTGSSHEGCFKAVMDGKQVAILVPTTVLQNSTTILSGSGLSSIR